MRPVVTDRVAWSVGLSVCRSVTLVSPVKTTEPIEMPFGFRTRVGPGNHVLDGGPEVLRDVVMAMHFCLSMGYNFVFTARRNARIESAVLAIAIPSVCLSVCLSVSLSKLV